MPNTVKVVEIDQIREKIVEILKESGVDCPRITADHLIANGVTLKDRDIHWATEQAYKNGYEKGKQDAVKWISVKDRFPEDVYGKDRERIVVLVRTKSGNVSQCARMADYECIADETLTKVEWIKNGQFYWSQGKKVTHWMPLPEAPKGE